MLDNLFNENEELKILEDDAYIFRNETNDGDFYIMKLEGFILYCSKDELIETYTEILDKFKDILEDNDIYVKDKNNSKVLYRTYDIEIKKYGGGFMVFATCPYFEDITSCYNWLEGVINQLNGLNFLG